MNADLVQLVATDVTFQQKCLRGEPTSGLEENRWADSAGPLTARACSWSMVCGAGNGAGSVVGSELSDRGNCPHRRVVAQVDDIAGLHFDVDAGDGLVAGWIPR
jgi:hypothetical protein